MSAAIKIGDPVRSVATHHLGRVVEIGKYDDGATRLHVDYTTGASVSCPVDAIEPLPARPFQVGDRVRITDHNRRHVAPDVQYVFEGIVSRIDPAAEPESGHDFGPYLWADVEPFVNSSGATITATFCPLTDDLTAALEPPIGRSIELLEPAPTIPSDGAVTAPTPAPSDATSLVTLDRDDAMARVLNAAMNWEATETAAPWEHAEAEAALRDAARDYRAVTE